MLNTKIARYQDCDIVLIKVILPIIWKQKIIIFRAELAMNAELAIL